MNALFFSRYEHVFGSDGSVKEVGLFRCQSVTYSLPLRDSSRRPLKRLCCRLLRCR